MHFLPKSSKFKYMGLIVNELINFKRKTGKNS